MTEVLDQHLYDELSRVPEPLAENLETRLAMAAMRKYETKSDPEGLLRSAWNYAEYALNSRDARKEVTEEYLFSTQLLTEMAIKHKKVSQDVMLGAYTLSSYVPLFHKRSSNREIDSEDCESIYKSLGYAIKYLRPLHIDEPPQWRMTEISMLALSARSRQPHLLMYPTSPREESSGIASLNHDSYFYSEDGKIPIQQKILPTQKTYDECIRILTVVPLIDKSFKKTGEPEKRSLADKVNYLLALIVAETSGMNLTKDETLFMNSMTEAVVAHYFDSSIREQSSIAA